MVALQKELFPRQRVDELKIGQRLLKRHSPRDVPRQHDDIVITEVRKIFADALNIVCPLEPNTSMGLFVPSDKCRSPIAYNAIACLPSFLKLKCVLDVFDARGARAMAHVGVDLRHIEAGGRVKAVHAQIEQRGGAQLFLFFAVTDSRGIP